MNNRAPELCHAALGSQDVGDDSHRAHPTLRRFDLTVAEEIDNCGLRRVLRLVGRRFHGHTTKFQDVLD